ncbi:MAG: histidine kinase, partial [Rhodoferax sp.]|nr:histidine kinase [Rhodoferax sp.]
MTESASPAAPSPYLTEPMADLRGWLRYFLQTEIPVLAATSAALEEMRAMEDEVDAAMLGAVIQSDPLMTLKLLAHVAAKRRAGDIT